MSIVGTRIAIGTTAQLILPLSQGLPGRSLNDPWPGLIQVVSGSVDFGGESVVAGEGFPANPGDPWIGADILCDDELYAISAAGAVIAVLVGRQ